MSSGSVKRTRGRRVFLPYAVAAIIGIFLAWLVVVLYLFPVDPDLATPEVPNVVGISFQEAERKLETVGFTAVQGEVRPTSKATDMGKVLEQIPPSGMRQKAGAKVLLHTGGPVK